MSVISPPKKRGDFLGSRSEKYPYRWWISHEFWHFLGSKITATFKGFVNQPWKVVGSSDRCEHVHFSKKWTNMKAAQKSLISNEADMWFSTISKNNKRKPSCVCDFPFGPCHIENDTSPPKNCGIWSPQKRNYKQNFPKNVITMSLNVIPFLIHPNLSLRFGPPVFQRPQRRTVPMMAL